MLARIAKLLKIQPTTLAESGLLLAHGTTVPADGTAGYATGFLPRQS